MAKHYTFGGSLYEYKGRWYWKVKLPTADRRQTISLHRTGELSTKSEAVAKEFAQRLWDVELKKAGGIAPPIATVGELKEKYRAWLVEERGEKSWHVQEADCALGLLDCDSLPIEDFGAMRFRQARDKMIGKSLSVKTVNARAGIIRRMFEWAAGREYVRPDVPYGLKLVENVNGKTAGIKPSKSRDDVSIEAVRATLPYLSSILQAAVRVQLYCGMRPSETLTMRPCDIDTSGDIWIYAPQNHKNTWRGEKYGRVVGICKAAQSILIPIIAGRKQEDYIFKPADAVSEFREAQRKKRTTPLTSGNRSGTNCKGTYKFGERYTDDGYRQAVKRAVIKLNEARAASKEKKFKAWTPYQLRHTIATLIRAEAGDKGLSIVQAYLGQRSFNVAELYAKIDKGLIIKAAELVDKNLEI